MKNSELSVEQPLGCVLYLCVCWCEATRLQAQRSTHGAEPRPRLPLAFMSHQVKLNQAQIKREWEISMTLLTGMRIQWLKESIFKLAFNPLNNMKNNACNWGQEPIPETIDRPNEQPEISWAHVSIPHVFELIRYRIHIRNNTAVKIGSIFIRNVAMCLEVHIALPPRSPTTTSPYQLGFDSC